MNEIYKHYLKKKKKIKNIRYILLAKYFYKNNGLLTDNNKKNAYIRNPLNSNPNIIISCQFVMALNQKGENSIDK